jgi:hypothetical protein
MLLFSSFTSPQTIFHFLVNSPCLWHLVMWTIDHIWKSPYFHRSRDMTRGVIRIGNLRYCIAQHKYARAGGTVTSSDVNRRELRKVAIKNVQVASGCITNGYESSEGVSRCHCEVLMPQRIAAMPPPVVGETRTSKSCITRVSLRVPAIQNGRRFPRQSRRLVPASGVNQEWSRESNLRRHESSKQMYTQRLVAR